MRKKERAIQDRGKIEEILDRAIVCRIALSENDLPYIVPVCFGYSNDCLYFHCAPEGRKLDILRKNNRVCFEVDIECEPVKSDRACSWGMRYRSVVGFGTGLIVWDEQEKRQALNLIMEHYGGRRGDYAPEVFGNTTVVKIVIESMTGKKGRS
jgi:uncharacterized protein